MVVAKEFGLFDAEGLDVRLFVERSWAKVADKLTYGLLDGAVMLPPLAFAISLGLHGSPQPPIVPLCLSPRSPWDPIDFATIVSSIRQSVSSINCLNFCHGHVLHKF